MRGVVKFGVIVRVACKNTKTTKMRDQETVFLIRAGHEK
jgi:hypothetical protein